MPDLLQDVRYAVRGLLRAPGFTILAGLTLAIGIGANTAMFSVVNAVLLRPLPYREPSRLVALRQSLPAIPGANDINTTARQYLDYRDRTRSFDGLAAYTGRNMNVTGAGDPERVQAARISQNLFAVLGAQPQLGRTFTADEDRYGGPRVVILGYGMWQRRFGGNPAAVGSTLRLDDIPHTIVGVMPSSFQFPYPGTPGAERADLWVPMAFAPFELQTHAGDWEIHVVGQLKNGVSASQALADVNATTEGFMAEHPEIYTGKIRVVSNLAPLQDVIVAGVRPLLLLLFGAVMFVLLIACANVANLLLARAAARQREIAIRNALGASGGRIIRQLITEALVLAAAGGAAGAVLAYWSVRIAAGAGSQQLPRLAEAALDARVLAFTLALSIATGLLFGSFPAMRLYRTPLGEALKEGARAGASRGRHRWNYALVAFETAAAMVLLIGAGLLINSFVRVLRAPTGFDPDGVLIARTAFDRTRYPGEEPRNVAERKLLLAAQSIPGVKAVGIATHLPLADDRRIGFTLEGENANEVHFAANTMVTPGYFDAMGIALQRGRLFTDADVAATPPVAIVSASMARKFWPNANPIGKRFSWAGRPAFSVAGIVEDVKVSSLDAESEPVIYLPLFQNETRQNHQAVLILSGEGDPAAWAGPVRQAIWSVDGQLPVYDVRSMADVMAESLQQRRFTMVLLASFSAIALLLAVIGLYGVLSYSVAQRSQELGVRMALGASRGDVLRLVLGSGMRVAVAGVACGLAVGALLSRFMSRLVFGVSALDPWTYASVALVLLAVSIVASYVPAYRATRVDPMVALRHE